MLLRCDLLHGTLALFARNASTVAAGREGNWEVKGGLEGRWTSYSQGYTCCIEGTTLYVDEHRTSEVIDVLDARMFKVEEAGKTYYGELTNDGFSQWKGTVWVRAHRTSPPSIL